MRTNAFRLSALALCALATLIPVRAFASGFFLTERGVRTLGRGGAFVAGAEGAESLWINPAGLKGAGKSFRMEGNATLTHASFQRIDDGNIVQPTVDLNTAFLPVPLFGITNDFDLDDWDFGIALYTPSASVYRWPDNVDGQAAPQRYSLYSLQGSIFGNLAVGAAWHGLEGLSIGLSAALITGRFKATTALSACDGLVCVHPEDPDFDATATIVRPFATMMLGAGLTYEAGPITFGVSAQSPWTIKGEADVDVKLPSSPIFADAVVDGNKGDVNIPFPWIGRAGLQYKPVDALALEVAATYEAWSVQDEISVKSDDIYLRNIVGIGDYQVGTIKIQRLMTDAISMRAGFEYLLEDMEITLRGGVSYDQTALKDNALSPLTLDSNKVVLGMGATLHLGSVMEVDFVYGHVFMEDREIRDTDIVQPAALRPAPVVQSHIANGNYKMEADFFGLGSTTHF